MQVGITRENVLIALFMYIYGTKSVESLASTTAEADVKVKGQPISIKTKSSKGYGGIQLIWTVDWTNSRGICHAIPPYKPPIICTDSLGRRRCVLSDPFSCTKRNFR